VTGGDDGEVKNGPRLTIREIIAIVPNLFQRLACGPGSN
jgi:hypothetical protein